MLATVAAISGISLLIMLGYSMISPVLPSYALSFGVDLVGAGIAVSAYSAARMFLDLPIGLLSTGIDRRKIMSAGLLMLAAGNIMCWAAPSYWILIAGRLAAGAGSVLYLVNAIALLAEISPENRGSILGGYTSTFLIGGIIGPFIGGIVADIWGLGAPFLIFGLLMLPATGLVMFTGEPGITRHEIVKISRLLDRGFITACIVAGLLFAARIGVRAFLAPLYGAHILNMNWVEIGLALSGLGLANAISAWPAGLLSDKIGRRPLIATGLIGIAVFSVLIPLSTDRTEFYILLTALGFVYGLTSPIPALVADNAPTKDLRAPIGLYRMMTDAGGMGGPVLLGVIAGSSRALGPQVFIAVSLIAASSLVLLLSTGEGKV